MKKICCMLIASLSFAITSAAHAGNNDMYLSDLIPAYENNVYGCLAFDKVYWAPSIVIDGVTYAKGLGMHAPDPNQDPNPLCSFYSANFFAPGVAKAAWNLNKAYDVFKATIGFAGDVDMSLAPVGVVPGVIYKVYADDILAYESGIVGFDTVPYEISISIKNVSTLRLEVVEDGSNWGAHAVWADARVRLAP